MAGQCRALLRTGDGRTHGVQCRWRSHHVREFPRWIEDGVDRRVGHGPGRGTDDLSAHRIAVARRIPGLDIELAEALAGQLGIAKNKIQFVPVTTATREAFLEQNKVDMIVAAYTMTAERNQVVDFAGPYLESPSVFLVKAGNHWGSGRCRTWRGKGCVQLPGAFRRRSSRGMPQWWQRG